MPRAIWNDTVLAESDRTVLGEGNYYFPPDSVVEGFLTDSDTTSRCAWKGTANYKDVVVNGQVNRDAAFYYADPSRKARHIRDHVAFWRGVRVED